MDTIIFYIQEVNAARRYWVSMCTIVAIRIRLRNNELQKVFPCVLEHTLELNPTLQRMANVHERSHPSDRAC